MESPPRGAQAHNGQYSLVILMSRFQATRGPHRMVRKEDKEKIVERSVEHMYLDCWETWLFPEILSCFLFQQDGAPSHYLEDVTAFLIETFLGRSVGRE
ncbi:hypothetical protein AVEN_160147-1 [Araneus ventricosus]|uniref:Uncharacterized protein n=1 Tax=Araneus ventricosus TaxID=182803 RepID=A0A4Y2TJE5_ARAVE|nr:hypothetical protein AVEN_160147-1 [Araneus ventricosus]